MTDSHANSDTLQTHPAAAGGTRAARLLALAAFTLATIAAVAFAFTPLRTSHDEFWQLKTGQWITQHRALPPTDIFTYTAEDKPWHNHEWLTQIAMWKLYEWGEGMDFGGWRLIILLKTLFVVLAYVGFGLLLARRMRQPVWAALAAALAVALARRTFYPRPPVISNLLLALTFWLLIEWRAGRLRQHWLWLLAPIFALWGNLHGAWLAGLIVLGAFWAEAALSLFTRSFASRLDGEAPTGNPEGLAPRRRLGFLTLLGAACALATLANPSGYHLIELTLRVMTSDRYLLPRIGEMAPPDWHFVWIIEGVILTLAAVAIRPLRLGGLALTALLLAGLHYVLRLTPNPWIHTAVTLPVALAAIARVRPPGWIAHALLLCFFTQQGLHHVRHLTLMAVIVLPTLAWGLEGWAAAWANRGGRPQTRERLAAAAALCVLAALGGFWLFGREHYAWRNRLLARGVELQPVVVKNTPDTPWWAPSTLPKGFFMMDAYPVKAVDFIVRARLPRRLWNSGNNAGYLIWRLAPEKYKIFTDNRYDIYGGLVIRQEHSVSDGYDAADLEALRKRDPDYFKGEVPPTWDKVLERWGVQTVFIEAEARGNMRLAQGGWARVWEDYDFNIWVRDTPANKAAIERARSLSRPLTARPF